MTNLDFGLPTADELFTTQAERDEAKTAKLHEIEVNKIDQFPKHPYKVRNDADMYNLMESIKEHGVLTPAIVRQKTELIPEILRMVDDGQIAMRPAVEISYLPQNLQEDLADAMAEEACTPSHDQTIRMRRLCEAGQLNRESILATMREEKPNQRTRITIDDKKAKRYLPQDLPISRREEYILQALEFYQRHLEREKEMER